MLKLVYIVYEACKLVFTTCHYVKCVCCFVQTMSHYVKVLCYYVNARAVLSTQYPGMLECYVYCIQK